jgi:hypothetical protein
MTPTNKFLLFIILDATLFAAGILAIIIPCIVANNFYALLSILVFSFSLLFPFLCNAFSFESMAQSDAWLFEDNEQAEFGKSLAWLFMGTLISIGFSIPFLLWRSHQMVVWNMATTMGGGTLILLAIALFAHFIIIPKRWGTL